MRTRAKGCPPKLRHVIREAAEGRFELVTWYGYVIKSFETRAEAKAYYDLHNP